MCAAVEGRKKPIAVCWGAREGGASARLVVARADWVARCVTYVGKQAGEPFTYRFKVPKGKVVTIQDQVRTRNLRAKVWRDGSLEEERHRCGAGGRK